MKNPRLLLAVTFVAVWLMPSQASAQGGWWDWLDGFSGPGPFYSGWDVEHRVACKVKSPSAGLDASGDKAAWAASFTGAGDGYRGKDGFKCLTNSSDVVSTFEVRFGRITSEEQALFNDTPAGELVGKVAAHNLQGYLKRRIHPALDVGVGAGVLWFSGGNVEGHPARFVFTPVSVSFMPLKLFLSDAHAKIGGLVSIRYEEIAVIGTLRARDFNSQSTSSFETHGDLVRSVSIMFDALTLWKD